jgi:hypothetical protein
MTVLKELIDILDKKQSPPLKAWLSANVNTRLVQLYQGIARNQWKSDLAASLALYGNADSAAYRKLKSALKAKLLEFVIYVELDVNQFPENELSRLAELERDLIIEKLKLLGAKAVMNEFDEVIAIK